MGPSLAGDGPRRRGLSPSEEAHRWTGGTGSDCTAPTSWAWRRSASPCLTCRSTSARRGSRTGRSASSRRWRRCRGLAQFPVGLWSDRIGWRKPFLVVALALLALATVLIRGRTGRRAGDPGRPVRRERHLPRGRREPLRGRGRGAGPQDRVGAALGRCGSGSRSGSSCGPGRELDVGAIRRRRDPVPLVVVQGLAVVAALLIHEPGSPTARRASR